MSAYTVHSPGPRNVLIVSVPPGEAPEDVRAAWVGMVLPLAVPGLCQARVFGVLTRPGWGWVRWLLCRLGLTRVELGYAVEAARAVALLEAKDGYAATWWRSNAPGAIAPGRNFLFSASCCRELP